MTGRLPLRSSQRGTQVVRGVQSRSDRLVRCREPAARSLQARRQVDPHSPKPISEQPHRAGSSPRQAPHSVHARLQVGVERRHHSFRHRDGPHDAQATGEVYRKPPVRTAAARIFSVPDCGFSRSRPCRERGVWRAFASGVGFRLQRHVRDRTDARASV